MSKLHKFEMNGQLLTATSLKPTIQSLEIFKLSKIILAASGNYLDKGINGELAFTSLFSIVAHNSSSEHYDHLQHLLLNTLVDSELNPITNIDTFLEDKNINVLDLVFKLFTLQLSTPLLNSALFKKISPVLDQVKQSLGMFDNVDSVDSEVEELTEGLQDEPEPTA